MAKITLSVLIAILVGAGILATMGFTVTNEFTVTNPAMAQTDNATMAGNMTGENMTMGNMAEASGHISGGGRCGGTCYTESD